MMRLSSYQLLRAYAWLMMVFLVLPLLIVVGTSFNEGSAIMFPPQSVTLHWYAEVWSNTSMLQSAVNSLILAGGATFFSILIGVPAAIALVRHVGHAKELLQAFLLAPMTVPSIVLGIAFLIFYGWTGAGLSFTTLLISHVIVTLPYVIRSVAGVYLGVSPTIEEAAKVLGANPWNLFQRVTLPLILPGVMAGAVFSFVMSFDNVPVSIFLVKRDTITLPVYIISYLVHNFNPSIAAISSIQLIFAAFLVFILDRVYGIRRLTETM